MPDKIVILKESGEQVNSNIVSVFLVPESNKKYIITTENATDPHGLNILHVSEINGDELLKIATEQEWLTIKNIMRAIISGNVGPYQYEKPIEQAKVNGQYYRDISVSATASKQMTDNYKADLKKKADEEKAAAKAKKEAEEKAEEEANNPAPAPSPAPTPAPAEAPKTEIAPKPEDVVKAPNDINEIEPVPAPSLAPEAQPAPAPVAAEPPKPVEVRQNPETAALNSLEDAEPTPVAPVVESKEEQEENIIKPSTIFPPDEEEKGIRYEISPGISEVDDDDDVTIDGEEADDDNDDESEVNVSEKVAPPVVAEATPVIEITEDKEENDEDSSEMKATKVSIDFTVPANFDPNATLDEVLVGAQEVFLEGVKNLVQTMTEKIYRDYYEKEKELREREKSLAQREKLLNDQIELINKQFDNKED